MAGQRLFKVPTSLTGATRTADVNANPVASPALISLDVLSTPTPHIAIGTTDGFLRTYRAADLVPGPLMDLKVGLGPFTIAADEVMTPSVPVQPDGSVADEAPFVYVAASAVFPFFPPGGSTTPSPTSSTSSTARSSSSSSSCRSRTPTRRRGSRPASWRRPPRRTPRC